LFCISPFPFAAVKKCPASFYQRGKGDNSRGTSNAFVCCQLQI
jgi:hypothetical protein